VRPIGVAHIAGRIEAVLILSPTLDILVMILDVRFGGIHTRYWYLISSEQTLVSCSLVFSGLSFWTKDQVGGATHMQ
jgi:hypothetical protein